MFTAYEANWNDLKQINPVTRPWKMDEKLKNDNVQKRAVFYVYVIFWEQSWQAVVDNGAMLTTYLFRYTLECTIS